jgi:hypothetical protein
MPQVTLSNPTVLNAALEGLQMQRARLEEQISMIQALLGRRGPGRPKKSTAAAVAAAVASSSAAGASEKTGKKRLSAAARKRIADAQKRRWAKFRQEKAAQ